MMKHRNNLEKNALMVVFFIFYAVSSEAQVNYKTQNYTHDLSPIKVSISFFNMEQILTPITAGILVEGHLRDKLFYNIQYRHGYLSSLYSTNTVPTEQQTKGSVFEAGVDFPFSDVIREGKVKVTTSASLGKAYTPSGDALYLNENFFKAKCEVRRYWALSGGVMNYKRFKDFNQSTSGLYAGIVRRKIKKALVSSNGRNYRSFYSTKFYAQVLIGSTPDDDFIYNPETYKLINEPIGYRLGWQWDQMGIVTGFEFGKMPGVSLETTGVKDELSKIFGTNPYLNYVRVTFHFNIFKGDRNYAMKKMKK